MLILIVDSLANLVPSSGKFRSIIIAQLDRHVRMLSRRLPLSAIRIDRLADNQRDFMTGIQGKTPRYRDKNDNIACD